MTITTISQARPSARRRAAGVLLALTLPLPVVGAAGTAEAGAPSCAGHRATLVGTARSETLRGTPGRDVIVGRGGADTILGAGGADVVCGGGGADRIDAGAGRDVVRGGAGGDTIVGGAGGDRLAGDTGPDRIDGGAGRDTVSGGAGRDLCGGERRSGCEGRLPVGGVPPLPTGQPPTPTDPCPAAACQPGRYPTRWVVDVEGREVRTSPDSQETVDWEATVVLVRVGDPTYQWNWQQESGSGSYHRTGHTMGGRCTVDASGRLDTFRSDLSLVPTQRAYLFDIDASGPGTSTVDCPASGGASTVDDVESVWAATGGGPTLEPWDLSGAEANGSLHQDGEYVDRDVTWVITPR